MLTFTEFCEEYLDLHVALMSEEQVKEARKGYALRVKEIEKEDKRAAASDAKRQKALEKAKEARKLAKFYGGKALTGSASQKKWAEEIRQKVFESGALTDEEKVELAAFDGSFLAAKFWINNKDRSPLSFKPSAIRDGMAVVRAAYEKNYDVLVSSYLVSEIERARKEVYAAICSMSLEVCVDVPNCDFYDNFGSLKRGLTFRC